MSRILFLSLLIGLYSAPAYPCSCPKFDYVLSNMFVTFRHVFVGTVVDRAPASAASSGYYKIELKVSRSFQGASAPEITVYTHSDGASCGFTGFEVGDEFLVFAYVPGNQNLSDEKVKAIGPTVTKCGPTTRTSRSISDTRSSRLRRFRVMDFMESRFGVGFLSSEVR